MLGIGLGVPCLFLLIILVVVKGKDLAVCIGTRLHCIRKEEARRGIKSYAKKYQRKEMKPASVPDLEDSVEIF